MMKNYHAILGVAPTATEEEIRRAYQMRVRIVHPDRFTIGSKDWKNASAMLAELNEAYEYLRNDTNRKEHQAEAASPQTPPPSPPKEEPEEEATPETEPPSPSNGTPERKNNESVIGQVIASIFVIVAFFALAVFASLGVEPSSFDLARGSADTEQSTASPRSEKQDLISLDNQQSTTTIQENIPVVRDDSDATRDEINAETGLPDGFVLAGDFSQAKAYIYTNDVFTFNDDNIILTLWVFDYKDKARLSHIDYPPNLRWDTVYYATNIKDKSLVALGGESYDEDWVRISDYIYPDGNIEWNHYTEEAIDEGIFQWARELSKKHVKNGTQNNFDNASPRIKQMITRLELQFAEDEKVARIANDAKNLITYEVKKGAQIIGDVANCRSAPTMKAPVLTKYPKGTMLFVTGEYLTDKKQLWYRVELSNNIGWIHSDLLKIY